MMAYDAFMSCFLFLVVSDGLLWLIVVCYGLLRLLRFIMACCRFFMIDYGLLWLVNG